MIVTKLATSEGRKQTFTTFGCLGKGSGLIVNLNLSTGQGLHYDTWRNLSHACYLIHVSNNIARYYKLENLLRRSLFTFTLIHLYCFFVTYFSFDCIQMTCFSSLGWPCIHRWKLMIEMYILFHYLILQALACLSLCQLILHNKEIENQTGLKHLKPNENWNLSIYLHW